MNTIELKSKPKDECLNFIRKRLAFNDNIMDQLRYVNKEDFINEHKRFDMSGYERNTGQNTVHNQEIINLLADLGIYDYTQYLFIDFYKGHGTLYLKYFNESENIEINLGGYSTTAIIYEVFTRTIFTNKSKRRRN